jgi:hypothetical protein
VRLRDVTATHERILRELASRISASLEAEFSEVPGAAEGGTSVGITLRERQKHVLIEIPVALLAQAVDDPSARERMRVRMKMRRDRMLFRPPPTPLPKHIASAPAPGGAHMGFGGRGGGNFRGRR